MKHVMLDLETMSTEQNAALTELAAVEFDPLTGETGREFHVGILLASSAQLGLHISQTTIDWWNSQSDEAKQSYNDSQETALFITEALAEFSSWLEERETEELFVWGNGVMSDNVWLRNAYKAAGLDFPIKHNEHMDVRTLVELGRTLTGKDYKQDMEFTGVPHNPIDDCKHQIKYVSAYYQGLK